MATSIANNSQVATVTTEHTLRTETTSGTFVLGVDTNAMVLADILTLRVKLKIRSVGTTRTIYTATYSHVQEENAKVTIPVASTNEVVFTLEQEAGTSRTFPWEIWSL